MYSVVSRAEWGLYSGVDDPTNYHDVINVPISLLGFSNHTQAQGSRLHQSEVAVALALIAIVY